MVEYETLGIVIAVMSLVSFQVKLLNDKFNDKLSNEKELAKHIHSEFKEDLDEIKKYLGIIG